MLGQASNHLVRLAVEKGERLFTVPFQHFVEEQGCASGAEQSFDDRTETQGQAGEEPTQHLQCASQQNHRTVRLGSHGTQRQDVFEPLPCLASTVSFALQRLQALGERREKVARSQLPGLDQLDQFGVGDAETLGCERQGTWDRVAKLLPELFHRDNALAGDLPECVKCQPSFLCAQAERGCRTSERLEQRVALLDRDVRALG